MERCGHPSFVRWEAAIFESAWLLGTTDKSIIVQTRAGTPIPNTQALPPTSNQRAAYARLRSRHPGWRSRRDAIGYYNCFGHVWASRRTAIYEEQGVSLILREDGYRKLRPDERLIAGDLAMYWNEARTSIDHVGIVWDPDASGTPQSPLILSKWGDHFGEDIHSAYDVPDDVSLANLEWWTDR